MTREDAQSWAARLQQAGARVTVIAPGDGALGLRVSPPPLADAPPFLARQRAARRRAAYLAAGLGYSASFTDPGALGQWWAATRDVDRHIEQIGMERSTHMTREEAFTVQAAATAAGATASLVQYPDDSFGVRVWPADADPLGPAPAEVRQAADYVPPPGSTREKA